MKVVYISTMLPSGHYSQILTGGLAKHEELDLIVYTDKDLRNLNIKGCGEIKDIWRKGALFIFDIVKNLLIDKPDVVHIQHEMNMYGSITSAIVFPILPLTTRLLGIPTVITIHGLPSLNQIDENFINIFGYNPAIIKPWMLKVFFRVLFGTAGIFSNKIVVHTELMRKTLIKDNGIRANKVIMIPTAIPHAKTYPEQRDKTFLYFGYMVRRKGLGNVIEGFKKFLQKNPLSPYRLILAGGVIKGQEPAFEEIKGCIKDLGIEDKIEITGFVEQEKQDTLYNRCYAAVIPAILSIAASGPLYHAYSHSRCPIASRLGNFEEEVQPNTTGILTENSSWDTAFETAVNNPELVSRIEENLLEVAKRRSPEATAVEYCKLYASLIKKEKS